MQATKVLGIYSQCMPGGTSSQWGERQRQENEGIYKTQRWSEKWGGMKGVGVGASGDIPGDSRVKS